MRTMRAWAGVLIALLCASAASAQSFYPGSGANTLPPRKALIVGVSSYVAAPWGMLPNVQRDVPAIKDALGKLGFNPDLDQYVLNDGFVTRQRIFEKLYTFMEDARLAKDSVLVFYFAGHGFTYNNSMYLVPADAPIRYAEDPDRFAIRLADVVDVLQAAKPFAAVVIVDACRDVPFTQLPSIYNLANQTTVITGGMGELGKPAFEDDASNVAVLYSATRGTKAPDGEPDKTSYFARAVSESIDEAVDAIGSSQSHVVTISEIVEEVVDRVRELTQRKQNPRPDIPFSFKIPMFATEDAFKTEAHEWEKLQNQITIDGPKIPDWSAAKVKELVYCRVREFRRAFGYAYFWREVTASMNENYTPDAVSKCRNKSAVASAPLFAPTTAAVVSPAGTVDERKIRTEAPAAPAAAPASPPGTATTPEAGLLAAAAAQKGPKAVLLKAASLSQPTFPGGSRAVPLPAGESVTFVEYADASKATVRVFHERHGFGLLPGDALLVLNGIVRIALSYDRGQVDYSTQQQEVLYEQLTAARVTRAASTSIRFAKGDGRVGFRRAQAIAAYLQTTPALPVDASINAFFPDIAEDPELKPGVVTISMIIETSQGPATPAPAAAAATPPGTDPAGRAPLGVRVFDTSQQVR